ncbi:MAG: aspartate kinase [Epsilonproteobacteria bacterium]|nr:aspartate kinase [Campylobacterota bacterium]
MATEVFKFGGSSVGSLERIQHVAELIKEKKREIDNLVVVVSAMQGKTDELLNMAKFFTEIPDERETDLLLSSGERISSSLLAIALDSIGCRAVSMTGRQVGMQTDDAHTRARIRSIKTDKIRKNLQEGKVAVVAGFQGIDENGDVTTLGRGGSDTSAVALAAALRADRCIIYTDVAGVYTADPRIVKKASIIKNISYDEMMELASLGAKVLQIRSVEMAERYNVIIVVKSTFEPTLPGTIITKEGKMENRAVSGVTGDKNQAKITILEVPDKLGIAAAIFKRLSEKKIIVDMIVQNVSDKGMTDISFTVPADEIIAAKQVIEPVCNELNVKAIKTDKDVAKVSVVGVGMRNHYGVASDMFEVLSQEGINIAVITTSEIKISCLIEERYFELALRALHNKFMGG